MPTVSVVVGGTRRVGRWVSEALLVAGHRVHAIYGFNQSAAFGFANDMRDAEYDVQVHQADALEEAQLRGVIDSIAQAEGGINVLVNSWGPSVFGALSETSAAELEAMFRGNVLGAHNAVRCALPYLREAGAVAVGGKPAVPAPANDGDTSGGDTSGTDGDTSGTDERPVGGRIINFLTAASDTGRAFREIGAYAAAKAMLFSYSRSLAKELAPAGVTVNCISLGVADHPPEGVPPIEPGKIPSGRFVNEEDIAAALWYLTSPPASQVTGTVVNLGGGFNL